MDTEGFPAMLGDHGMDERGDVDDRAFVNPVVLLETIGAVAAYRPGCQCLENSMSLRSAGDVKVLPWSGGVSSLKSKPSGGEGYADMLQI